MGALPQLCCRPGAPACRLSTVQKMAGWARSMCLLHRACRVGFLVQAQHWAPLCPFVPISMLWMCGLCSHVRHLCQITGLESALHFHLC